MFEYLILWLYNFYTNQVPVHKINGISIVIDVAMDDIQ